MNKWYIKKTEQAKMKEKHTKSPTQTQILTKDKKEIMGKWVNRQMDKRADIQMDKQTNYVTG